ncbi:hexokinase-1 [Batrachochytrium salamandrivorans]|nr:hexokinase-1 [Batrachochytrium salamandrivorans]
MILNPVFAIGLASGISLSIAFQQLLALQPPTSRNSHRRRTTSATPTKLSISNASLLTNSRGELDSGFESADSSMAGMCSGDVFESLSRELGLSTHSLTLISAAMTKALKKGLLCDGQGLPMIPSHVVGLPKGSETGAVLALDLGGSNFRVCMVTLDGHGSARTIQRKFVLSDAVKTQTGTVLFDFLAKCIAEFMDENKKTAVNEGSLMYWNKGFTSNGVVGRDVVGLLQESLNRLGIKVRVTALVNDTVGTLVAHAYSRPQPDWESFLEQEPMLHMLKNLARLVNGTALLAKLEK